MFYGQGRIKRHHRWQMLYGERRIIMISQNIKTNKKTQSMRQSMRNLQLQTKCRAVWTYSNVVGIFWTDLTWHMNKREWTPKNKNTIRICWKLWLNIMIFQRHHFQKRNFENQSIQSWQKQKTKNEMPKVTPITWLRTLSFRLPSQTIHQERKQTLQMRAESIWTFKKKL